MVGEFMELCECFGTKHHTVTPAHLQWNGLVEHIIKTLKHGLIVMAFLPPII